MRQHEAAQELARRYNLTTNGIVSAKFKQTAQELAPTLPSKPKAAAQEFTCIMPVPANAPVIPYFHSVHGKASASWCYKDQMGNAMFHTVRFEKSDGKVVLPVCFGKYADSSPQWTWKAAPEPRPLYGLERLGQRVGKKYVLLVEGEKTADAAQEILPDLTCLTWSGGANSFKLTDFTPIYDQDIIIWPDNDEAGFKAAIELVELLNGKVSSISVILPPASLPASWDLADQAPEAFAPAKHIQTALEASLFIEYALGRFPSLSNTIELIEQKPLEPEDFLLNEWPQFSWQACPGLLGAFVDLATQDSEADPAAVCITTLVRFGAELYGYGGISPKGPHIYVGETVHPPRLFAVICGNSSKARKGTSRHPVAKLFGREYCQSSELQSWGLPLPAKESGGPLSTGEGLAYHVRDETDEERERWQRQNPNEPVREKGDKRLIIQDEEFASALTCTKREGTPFQWVFAAFGIQATMHP